MNRIPWWSWLPFAFMWVSWFAALIWADRRDRQDWMRYRRWQAQHDAIERMVDTDA